MSTRSLDSDLLGPVRRFSSLRNRKLSKSYVDLPRLVKRDLPFGQSNNKIGVENDKHLSQIWSLLVRDWFHFLMRISVFISIPSLLALWTCLVLAFALIYVKIDRNNKDLDCGLGAPGVPIEWGTAFAFSLETCTTVGYGLPGSTNAFFEANCPYIQVAIYAEMIWSMMFNAFLFAFFFAILSKCELRNVQVVFSDKLCIYSEGGQIYVGARCYDIDAAFPVVESHVRMYVLDKGMRMHPLRMHFPDDDMGGMLYTSLPAEMKHCVDHHSALSPRKMPLVLDSQGLVLRASDSATGNRDEIECPVCGEAYGSYERLRRHVNYCRIIETKDEYPVENSHLGFEMPEIAPLTLQEVKTYFENHISEIVLVVEGIDPQLSGTFQSLQSYKYEDVAWEGEFVPCLSVRNKKFVVDFAKFHKVRLPESPPSSVAEDDVERATPKSLATETMETEITFTKA